MIACLLWVHIFHMHIQEVSSGKISRETESKTEWMFFSKLEWMNVFPQNVDPSHTTQCWMQKLSGHLKEGDIDEIIGVNHWRCEIGSACGTGKWKLCLTGWAHLARSHTCVNYSKDNKMAIVIASPTNRKWLSSCDKVFIRKCCYTIQNISCLQLFFCVRK